MVVLLYIIHVHCTLTLYDDTVQFCLCLFYGSMSSLSCHPFYDVDIVSGSYLTIHGLFGIK